MSIVPIRDKKKFIILPSGKIKDIDIISNNVLIPLSTRDYSNVSKTIEVLNKKIEELNKRILDLESELSGNILKQRLEHANFKLKNYLVLCPLENRSIQLIQCKQKRDQKRCLNKCQSIKDFIEKIS